MTSINAHAMLPNCASASSDSDGDGFGWENNASCLVVTSTSAPSNNSGSTSGGSSSGGLPTCASASSDPDGDGFGWENNASCLVGAASSSNSGSSSSGGASSGSGLANCASAATDPDGDGYGFENGASCLVVSGLISDDAGSSTSNGISDDAGSSTSNGITPPGSSTPAPAGNTGNNSGGSFSSETGGAFLRSSSLTSVGTETVTVGANGGDLFATRQVGDFLINQNAWRAQRVSPGYNWTQSFSTNTNGIPVSWNYDWGPGVPGANGRASDDFYVRSYPELILGIKDEFRTSAPKSEIGFPVRVDQVPNIQIDYAFNGPQFGTSRTVDASVNPRFPNGSLIAGERNVAVESFLYTPTGGVCDDNLNVSRSNGSNHAYEVMVWLDSGAERLPAASRDFVTDVSLHGADYKVYTKSNDERYIAFVAQNPQTSGTVYWNDFLEWAQANAHRVQEQFGANSNSVPIQDSWCIANIIIGTEIFWGAGSFDLTEWTITQSQ